MREYAETWKEQHTTGLDLLSQFAQGLGGADSPEGQFQGTPVVQLLAALQALRKLLEQMHDTLKGMTEVKEEVWSNVALGGNATSVTKLDGRKTCCCTFP